MEIGVASIIWSVGFLFVVLLLPLVVEKRCFLGRPGRAACMIYEWETAWELLRVFSIWCLVKAGAHRRMNLDVADHLHVVKG